MASNRPAPQGPSTYGPGGPADFGGAVGPGGPAGPGAPAAAGSPVMPAQVPSSYEELADGAPPREPFFHDRSSQAAARAAQTSQATQVPQGERGRPSGDEPSHGPAGDADDWLPGDETGDGDAGRPVRGKHRVARQRGGLARGGTALGVGVIAAVGASGVAAAEGRPPVPISMPDPGGAVDDTAGTLRDAPAPPSRTADADGDAGAAGPAEALRHRILQQADARQSAAEQAAEAAEAAADAPGRQQEEAAQPTSTTAEEKAEPQGTTAAATGHQAAAPVARHPNAAAEHPAHQARTSVAPLSSYTLGAGFGQAGDRWAAEHTGQDFTAPTGTPVKAVHDGTITQAGWAGAYGYRIVLTLDDGTQLWFCHLSSMVRTTGRVHTGDVIGRVGATGNATGPHLHLEVRPHAGAPADPLPWLRAHGAAV
ncbi:M23 family metallopeptidase [Streptomyces sp. BHT-5-2]|uniref:M23 family metallopeptidase n=1 Tax=unclassified Streptomyces TaxID=2593676 RepID=UPI001C8E6669|nr:peptidoglycan DD-metalloendopeptidase family protein [Streptomyces sp. BHT-5-2]QZL02722.1 M23 family metallopeptidase [Streptomyces sp. BHT-5-2]